MSRFQRATKKRARLRLALAGLSGSGKTWTALELGRELSENGKVAVIDTERGSASKYSDVFTFDVLELESFEPRNYIDAIKDAERAGYDVIVIDSLSHAWSGKGGALDQVDKGGGRFDAWRNVTPQHNALVDAILGSSAHIIVTMRSKTEYVVEKNEKGKSEPRKVGLAPVQRDGIEYEFDVTADLDDRNVVKIGKTRCSALAGRLFQHQNKEIAAVLKAWLSDGAEPMAPSAVATAKAIVEKAVEEGAPGTTLGEMVRDHLARVNPESGKPAMTRVKAFVGLFPSPADAIAYAGERLGRQVGKISSDVTAKELEDLFSAKGAS